MYFFHSFQSGVAMDIFYFVWSDKTRQTDLKRKLFVAFSIKNESNSGDIRSFVKFMKLALKHEVTTGSITLVGCCEFHLVNVLHALHGELCESWHIQLSTAVWTHLYIQLLIGIVAQQVSVGIRKTQINSFYLRKT